MEAVQQVAGIVIVFGLLGLAVWKLRAGTSPLPWPRARGNSRALASVERIALTPQHAIHVVRVQGRELVVLTHPQGCSLLQELATGMDA
jgi:flagellar biogenesis protein FliO